MLQKLLIYFTMNSYGIKTQAGVTAVQYWPPAAASKGPSLTEVLRRG